MMGRKRQVTGMVPRCLARAAGWATVLFCETGE
jgi:hypothetical protein